ncbi:MAG: efflux RND transporter periplasmic adaptor subunit [Pseudomonadota bacterium]
MLNIYFPAAAQSNNKKPVEIIATTVKSENIVDRVEALGTLKAQEAIEVNSAITEIVTDIYFNDGQRVNKGDILIKLDMQEEEAMLAEEEFNLIEASRQLDRIKPLVAKGVTSESLLDESEREVKTAKSRINAIKSRIQQHVIVAPFSGVVGLRNLSVGALVQPGTVVTTLDDDRKMKLDFTIPSIYLQSLKEGSVINATTKAFKGKFFSGTIMSIDSRVDPITRSIQARAIIDNPEYLLKPGLLMTVNLQKNQRETLMINEESVITVADQYFVYLLKDNAATDASSADSNDIISDVYNIIKQPVSLGARQKGKVEIIGGLNVDDLIIAHGINKVSPMSIVTIQSVI